MLPLAMDAAVVRFRRIVAEAIAAEAGGARGAPRAGQRAGAAGA